MSESFSPEPRRKAPLGGWFWLVLFLPILLVLVAVPFAGINNGAVISIVLIPLGLATLICPIYCGVRLATHWAEGPGTRAVLGLVLILGLIFLYLAVAFGGCLAVLSANGLH